MRRVIDLSLTIDREMRGVDIQPCRQLATNGWNATTLNLYSHCGTHMDAPHHFLPEGTTIDSLDLGACVGPARVINLAPIAPRAGITPECLGDAAAKIGRNDRILLRTDWYRRHGTSVYRNELPRVTERLAQWLVARGVALLGVEPPSVADVNNIEELTRVHRILLGGNIVIVEGLAQLDQLETDMIEFIALPLKVHGGDGSPVRAIAIEELGDV